MSSLYQPFRLPARPRLACDRYALCIQHALDDLLNSCQKERADYRGCIRYGIDSVESMIRIHGDRTAKMDLMDTVVCYKYLMADSSQSSMAVAFRVENERYPFVGASRTESCRFELEEMVHRGEGVYSEFFRVEGADPDRILERAADLPQVEATLLSEAGNEALFEFKVAGGCIAVTLAEEGAYPQLVRGDDGNGVVVTVFEGSERALVRTIVDENAGLEFDEDRGDVRALTSEVGVTFGTLYDVLSDQQRDAFLMALSNGFYDWPQTATLTEVADALDVEEAMLEKRLHRCEQLLLEALFEDGKLSENDTPAHPLVKPSIPD